MPCDPWYKSSKLRLKALQAQGMQQPQGEGDNLVKKET